MKKKEPKKILIAVLIGVLIVFLIPIKTTLKDGGTKIYMSMFYKVICWHQINDEYVNEMETEGASDKEPFLTGTDVYIFPFNFISGGEKP